MLKCRGIGVIDTSKIQWIEGRTYSDTFHFKSDPLKALRVSYYNQKLLEDMVHVSKSKAQDLIETDPIRIENKMALIIESLIKSGFQPHYIQQIKNADCMDVLTHVAPAMPPTRRTILLNAENKDLQKRYNNVQVFLRHSGNMSMYMFDNKNKNDFHTKILLFQVLYGLGILQLYIKGFKHGNLTTNSVLIEKKNPTMLAVEYIIPGTSRVYVLPDLGFRARIADFDYASGTRVEVKGLENLSLKNFKKSKENDVAFFLKSVKTACPQTNAFVKRALKNADGDGLDVLLDPYFDVFRV